MKEDKGIVIDRVSGIEPDAIKNPLYDKQEEIFPQKDPPDTASVLDDPMKWFWKDVSEFIIWMVVILLLALLLWRHLMTGDNTITKKYALSKWQEDIITRAEERLDFLEQKELALKGTLYSTQESIRLYKKCILLNNKPSLPMVECVKVTISLSQIERNIYINY